MSKKKKKNFRIINPNYVNNDWYSNQYILSYYPQYKIFLTAGSRGRGKTYSGKNLILNRFNKHHPKKFAWIRLNEEPIEKILTNDGSSFFEQSLLRKKKVDIKTQNSNIFLSRRSPLPKKQRRWKHVGRALSLQKYADWKGVDFEDTDLIIIDELVRSRTQQNRFDIPSAFINTIENICRERDDVMILIYCNTIGEMTEIRDLFDFLPMPGNFGVYKLPHKDTIIEYLDDSVQWKRRKSKTIAGKLIGNKMISEFTNMNDTLQSANSEIWPRSKVRGKQHLFNLLLARNYVVSVYAIEDILWLDWIKYTDIKEKGIPAFSIHPKLVGGGVLFNQEVRTALRNAIYNDKIRYSDYSLRQDFFRYAESYNLITS